MLYLIYFWVALKNLKCNLRRVTINEEKIKGKKGVRRVAGDGLK